MITELKKPFPVTVTSHDNKKGLAHWIMDIGIEHHVIWGVVFDEGGEIWWIPNPEIRAQTNWTMGRGRKAAEEFADFYRGTFIGTKR